MGLGRFKYSYSWKSHGAPPKSPPPYKFEEEERGKERREEEEEEESPYWSSILPPPPLTLVPQSPVWVLRCSSIRLNHGDDWDDKAGGQLLAYKTDVT